MRSDFKKMEDEMEHLVVNMGEITVFNERIDETFKDKRSDMERLSSADTLLKKLQFVFDLPNKLTRFVDAGGGASYASAVKYYTKARRTLDRYKHMSTFKSIEDDCAQIIQVLKRKLYERLNATDTTQDIVSESVDLLAQLDEPVENLLNKYIERVEDSLSADLSTLSLDIDMLVSSTSTANKSSSPSDSANNGNHHVIAMDILEFVDYGCNNFLANLSSAIHSYNALFINKKSPNR
jgi:vacuolar protein sorting-associated protein 51